MSGIAGLIRFDGGPIELGFIENMTSAMPYRGPDGIAHWVRGSVALGQCMLHTTPQSLEETQPLANDDESVVLVMDGRVDNWEELRSELLSKRAQLRTHSDAELVLRAYELWGENCLSRIDGDFALVIWNGRRREVFCARDRMGNKPFNYHWNGRTLAFASELHALLALPWVPQRPNEGVIAEYVENEWFARDETLWVGVNRLPAAHMMRIDANGPQLTRYWEPDYRACFSYKSELELAEHYREILSEQVRRMSRSHNTLACEVSGGLDSSAIFAVAECLLRQNILGAPGLSGYSLFFPEDPDANEFEYSRSVARHLGQQVREVPPTYMPFSWYQQAAMHYREHPGYPNGIMNIGMRMTARLEGSTAILTGAGGDEWLGMPLPGSYYAEELAQMNWKNVYDCLMEDTAIMGTTVALWWLLRHGLAPLLPEYVKAPLRRISDRQDKTPSLLSKRYKSLLDERREVHRRKKVPRLARRGQRMQLFVLEDAFVYLAREIEERQAASLGLEVRAPLNSRQIVQLAFSTPERFRSRNHTTKRLHRLAFKDDLPANVIQRSTKADFMCTFVRQLDSMGPEHIMELMSRRVEWISPARLSMVYKKFQHRGDTRGNGKVQWILWTLLGCDAVYLRSSCLRTIVSRDLAT